MDGKLAPLPVLSSRRVKMGSTVATVGFPNIGLQGFAPKLAKGEIAALSGARANPRYLQISVPVPPGNSGGALVDERGSVVGVELGRRNISQRSLITKAGAPGNPRVEMRFDFPQGMGLLLLHECDCCVDRNRNLEPDHPA